MSQQCRAALRSRRQDKQHAASPWGSARGRREQHQSRAVLRPNHSPPKYRFPISPLNSAFQAQPLAFSPELSLVFSFLPFFPYIPVNVAVTPTTIASYSLFLVLLFYKSRSQKRCSHAACSALSWQVQESKLLLEPHHPFPLPMLPAHPPDLLWIFLFALCSPKISSASSSTKTDYGWSCAGCMWNKLTATGFGAENALHKGAAELKWGKK